MKKPLVRREVPKRLSGEQKTTMQFCKEEQQKKGCHCEPVTDVTGVAIRSPLVRAWILLSRRGLRIPTPVCAPARNDKREVRPGDSRLPEAITRSARPRGTEGYAHIRKTSRRAGD
jgi:hypothetical protein